MRLYCPVVTLVFGRLWVRAALWSEMQAAILLWLSDPHTDTLQRGAYRYYGCITTVTVYAVVFSGNVMGTNVAVRCRAVYSCTTIPNDQATGEAGA